MEQSPHDANSSESQSLALTRRQALKALAATTGAVLLSNVPMTWKTPILEVGALPAHAQGSNRPIVISELNGQWLYGQPMCTVVLGFKYADPLGQVNGGSTVNGTYAGEQPFLLPGTINGTGFAGSISLLFNSNMCYFENTSAIVQLIVGARKSNVLNGTVVPPTPAGRRP